MKTLILYTEIASYVTASLRFFLDQNPQAEAHLVKYPVNTEAPFSLKEEDRLHFYNRQDFNRQSLLEFAQKLSPDLILCSGWTDKDYLSVCKKFKGKIPVVLALDNKWEATAKQRVLTLIAPFTLHRTFSHVWVPGEPQKEYALKLGFKKQNIHTGFYCGDTPYFSRCYEKFRQEKHTDFPKRFLCVARYIPVKGLETLWEAFAELQENGKLTGWELWCLGAGADFDKRMKHGSIKHKGFVQPQDMEDYIKETGIFILPSRFEPWAVAVHEFAAAGYPLLLSKAVGASSAFLEEGTNGFSFPPDNKEKLKEELLCAASLSQAEYNRFSEASIRLSQKITPESWSNTLLQLIGEHKTKNHVRN